MSFRKAWLEMQRSGKKIKRPHWGGYWAWEHNTIMIHCKDGKTLDIRETDNVAYTFHNIASDDWIVVE